MRLIVIGALVVAALAIGLLFEVTGHSEPAAPTAALVQPASSYTAAPTVAPSAPAPEHHVAAPVARSAPAPAPSLAAPPAEAPAKPKHVDTPIEILRWSLMRAIRTTEPAVVDCIDKGHVVEGKASFAFYVTNKNAKAVIDRAAVDTSPFSDAVNACIVGTLASGELDQELPEGRNEYRVLRQVVVEKGAVTAYKLQSFIEP